VTDGPWRLADVLRASVWVAEARVGSVGDIYATAGGQKVVGLEIASPAGERWFLPWVTCTLEDGVIRCATSLVFIGADQLEFYVRHGMRQLREDGTTLWVEADGRVLRSLDDHAGGVLAVAGEGISNP
jgi:hypothetical protein